MAEETKFAFGAKKKGGCMCPVKAAGHDPELYPYTLIAEAYDTHMRHDVIGDPDVYEGIVSEEMAKEAFENALDYLRESYYHDVVNEDALPIYNKLFG